MTSVASDSGEQVTEQPEARSEDVSPEVEDEAVVVAAVDIVDPTPTAAEDGTADEATADGNCGGLSRTDVLGSSDVNAGKSETLTREYDGPFVRERS